MHMNNPANACRHRDNCVLPDASASSAKQALLLVAHVTPTAVPVEYSSIAGRVLLARDVALHDELAQGAQAHVYTLINNAEGCAASSPELIFKSCKASSCKKVAALSIEASVQSTAAACPYIVPVYSVALLDDMVGLVMPRYACTLLQLFNLGDTTEESIVTVAFAVSSALHYLHCMSISHNDVKMENILISSSGNIALADSGLATSTSHPPAFNPKK